MKKLMVSQSVYSSVRRDLEKKRKKVAKEQAELKAMEESFKLLKSMKLSRR